MEGAYNNVKATDEDEINVLTTTLQSLLRYEKTSIENVVNTRRVKLQYLDPKYRAMIEPKFSAHLDEVEECIKENGFFLSCVANAGAENFGAPQDKSTWSQCQVEDIQKSYSTLRQLAREWSTEGAFERSHCTGRILNELAERYPSRKERHEVTVLCPGSGLGRLPFDLACMGFKAEGNEFSYHMLFTSSLILNHTHTTNTFRIHPYVQAFSHNPSSTLQTKEVLIPDVSPTILTQHQVNDPDIPSDGLLSMTSGSFDMIYPADGQQFDVISTVYFLDTAANVFNTLQTIYDTLKPGGLWLNFGPLLWHYEEIMPSNGHHSQRSSDPNEDRSCGFEFALDDLLDLVAKFGFKMEKRESGIPSIYTASPVSMGKYTYFCEYWVATKPES